MKKYEELKLVIKLFQEDIITSSISDNEENFITGESIFSTDK